MLVRKTNPVGIDRALDRIQRIVYNALNWADYESYHRVYVNETPTGLKPERFDGDRDYIEVFFDDRFNATSYFVTNSPVVINEIGEYNISYFFQVKLDQLYPSIDHRADEEAHESVIGSLMRILHRNEISRLVTGVKNVYSGFDQSQIKYTDMEGFHVFRVDFILTKELACK